MGEGQDRGKTAEVTEVTEVMHETVVQIVEVKNEVSIQANDYEIERATGVLPARQRFIPLKYRDFRSADDVEPHDDQDSDYEPEPLTHAKEPKKKRGRGRPRKQPEEAVERGDKKPAMVRTANGYKCLTCHHVFSQKGNLKVHLLTHTNERPWQCDIENCQKGFRTKESLRRHKLSHMGIKPFECSHCHKRFCSAFSLQEHSALHQDQRPYTCPHCQRAFRQISCLRRHLVTHSPSKPHTCQVCGQHFSQAVYLRSHMKVHTGEKPFSCDQCNKAFAHASDLTRHKIIHTGSKPYSCSVCSMRFSDPSSRRRHEREHVSSKAYACHLCTESFKRASQLRTHLYRRHGGLREGVQFEIQEGAEPVCYRIELHDAASGGADTSSGKVVDLSALDQKKIISLIHNLNRNMAVQLTPTHTVTAASHSHTVEVDSHTVTDSHIVSDSHTVADSHLVADSSTAVGVDSESEVSRPATRQVESQADSQDPEACELPQLVLPMEVAVALDKGEELESSVVTIAQLEAGEMVQDLGSSFHIVQGVVGEDQSVYEVHYHPSASHPPASYPQSSDPQASDPPASESSTTLPSAETCHGNMTEDPAPPSPSACLHSDFVSEPDFSSQDYYDWLSGFTELCKTLAMPLDLPLFQKISQVHKSLSDFMASPSGVISDRGNFQILMTISTDLARLLDLHLQCMLHNLSDTTPDTDTT